MITFLVLNYLLLFTARHAVLPDSMDEYKLPVHDSTILLQWSVFTNTTFYTKRVDTLGGLDIAFPKFTDEQKKLKGKTVALKGYVIPPVSYTHLDVYKRQLIICLFTYP